MIDYLTQVNVESRLLYLKSAVAKGHLEAMCVYGMILLFKWSSTKIKIF
ncbi:hypothetical protein Hanom_Chr05g00388521 [Helianthus anomalus]